MAYIATVLITMPKRANDPTTYTYQWAQKMVKVAKGLGYKVVEIKGGNVNYSNVTAAIEKWKPRLYIHAGHGCPTSLNGQNECIVTRKFSIDEMLNMSPEKLNKLFDPVKLSGCGKDVCQLQINACSPLCLYDTNIHLLRDSIVYAVSCHSAEQLGKCAIQYGVQSYIGYKDLLLFPVDQMRSQDMFGEIHLEFIRHLLLGESVGEANDAMRSMEDTYIRWYKDTKWVGLPLLWNHLHRELLGDPNATIY